MEAGKCKTSYTKLDIFTDGRDKHDKDVILEMNELEFESGKECSIPLVLNGTFSKFPNFSILDLIQFIYIILYVPTNKKKKHQQEVDHNENTKTNVNQVKSSQCFLRPSLK